MHPKVLLSSLLLATSATAGPDLLRPRRCFIGPHGINACDDSMFPAGSAGEAAVSAASASSAAVVAASISSAAVYASATSAQYARGASQLLVASAMDAAAKSSVAVQEKLVVTSGGPAPSSTSTLAISSARDYGYEWGQAARYGHG